MPIYEYACESCGYQKEVFQNVKDAPLTLCEHCQKPTFKKLVSATQFRLKGTGWYETDFKTDNKKNLSTNQEPTKSSEPVAKETSTSTVTTEPSKDTKSSE